MKWSDKQTHLFVNLYLNHKCLWDTSHEHYRSKFKRRLAYRDVSTKFQALTNVFTDDKMTINKIKILRSTYSQELTKIRTRDTYTPNLKWFADWHRCFRKNRLRAEKLEGRSSDDQQEADTETDDVSKDWPGDETELEGNNSDLDRKFVEPDDEEEYSMLLMKQEPEIDVNPLPTYNSRKKKNRKHFRPDYQSREISTFESNGEPINDEFEIYARHIASQLRKMDVEKALRVQVQIQSLVSEARIASLNKISHIDV